MQLRSILGSRFLVLSIIALVAGVSLTVLAVHAHDWFSLVSRPTVTPSGSIAQGNKALLSDDWHGSLALQPEAEKQRRRLGRRFVAPGRETATLVGVLTIGNDRQIAAITRTQDSQGEGLAIGPRH